MTPSTWGFDDCEEIPTSTDDTGHFIIRNMMPALYRVTAGTPTTNNPSASSPSQAGVLLPQDHELVLTAP